MALQRSYDFFPARDVRADIDEQLFGATISGDRPGKALCFEDQYISTGGQLYEMIAGHDRFIADLRPLMRDVLTQRGVQVGLCCHPYDMCTELIARSCGIIVSDPAGGRLQAPLDLETEIAWTAYANTGIRDQIEPVLQRILQSRGLSIGQ